MDAAGVTAMFKAHELEESGRAQASGMALKPGERFTVRYFNEPVKEYDLREPEQVYGHARTEFAVGDKDAGKSAFLEAFGEGHLEHGNRLIDFWGSVDNESMAWGRSPWVKGRAVLVVHGPSVKLENDASKFDFDQKDANKLTPADYSGYDLILSSPKFFMDEDGTRDYTSMGRFVRRLLIHREGARPIIYCIIREASEVIYSRIKADERQDETKAQMLSLLGQARHIGIALGLDTQRAMNVDKAFRDLADHTVFKRPRGENVPEEKQFCYRYVDLQRMLRMEKNQFVVVDTTGVGEGLNYMPEWHKREEDIILPQLGVVQTFIRAPVEGKERGDYKTIGDEDHAQMMRLLQEGDGKRARYSMNEVADAWGVSTATPSYHVNKLHNPAVLEHGLCVRCERVGGKFAREVVGR